MPSKGSKKAAGGKATSVVNKEETAATAAAIDSRGGLKFGADVVAYGDEFYESAGDSEYVSSLPTEDEERKMFGDNDVKAKEQMEALDEGRVSHHPSTAATAKTFGQVSVISAMVCSHYYTTHKFQFLISSIFSPLFLVSTERR
jgi:hypothetical protein